MSIFSAWRKSLAARLLAVFLVTGIAMLVVITIAWGMAVKHQWNAQLRPHLVQYIDYVNQDLGSPPDIQRADQLARRVPLNIYIKGPGIDYSSSGQTLDMSEVDFRRTEHGPPWRHKRLRTKNGVRISIGEYDDRTLLRTSVDGYTVYYELRHRDRSMRRGRGFRTGRLVFWGTLALLLIMLGCCYWLIHRLLRPVRDIQTAVARMGGGELDHRITVQRNDDLGDLSHSINHMAGDIEQMLDAKRQMLLGISHELRSPITRAKISVALLESSSTRTRLEDDLLEMETLVTELLESERLNSRHKVLNPTAVNISELIDSVLSPSFAERVLVHMQDNLAMLNLDETRLRLLLRNLLGNAARYGGDSSPILHVKVTDDTLTIAVEDKGEGIAPEHLASLSEPFYRVDPSRTRATGGFGLGLYLCRLICEAHDGTLTIASTVGVGTTVTATLRSQ